MKQRKVEFFVDGQVAGILEELEKNKALIFISTLFGLCLRQILMIWMQSKLVLCQDLIFG